MVAGVEEEMKDLFNAEKKLPPISDRDWITVKEATYYSKKTHTVIHRWINANLFPTSELRIFGRKLKVINKCAFMAFCDSGFNAPLILFDDQKL